VLEAQIRRKDLLQRVREGRGNYINLTVASSC